MVRWLAVRVGVIGLVTAWALAGGPFLALFVWVVLGYLVWRASPAVWQDVQRLNVGRFMGGRGRRSSSAAGGVL